MVAFKRKKKKLRDGFMRSVTKAEKLLLSLLCSTSPNLPLQTHPCIERHKERGRQRGRVKERSLQSDHSGYFPRFLLVTMEIWKIAPAV